MAEDFEGGEAKPRKDTRWKRGGPTPNKYGRAGKPRDASSMASRAFDEKVFVTQDGKRRKLTKREVAAITIATDAAKGDKAAVKLMLSWMRQDEERKATAADAEARSTYRLSADDLKTIEGILARLRGTPPRPAA